MNQSRVRAINTIIGVIIVLTTVACESPPIANETWKLVELLSENETTETVPEIAEVRNCGIEEPKTIYCSAGTTSNLNVSIGVSVGYSTGFQGSIDSSVSTGLGVGKESGESIPLDVPPDGYVYLYPVTKTYSLISGKVLAQSSLGNEEQGEYAYHANCTIRIEPPTLVSCSQEPVVPNTPVSTNTPQLPTDTPTPPPTDTFLSLAPITIKCPSLNEYCSGEIMVVWENLSPEDGYLYLVAHHPYYNKPYWIAGNGFRPTITSGRQVINDGEFGEKGDTVTVFVCQTPEYYMYEYEGQKRDFDEPPSCNTFSSTIELYLE